MDNFRSRFIARTGGPATPSAAGPRGPVASGVPAPSEPETELIQVRAPDNPQMLAFTRWFLILVPPAVAGFYCWHVAAMPPLPREPIISPRAWPTGVAIVMALVAVAISLSAILRAGRIIPRNPGEDIGSWRDTIITLGAVAAFIVVVDTLGYILSTFLLVSGLSLLVSPTKWRRNVAVAALFALLSSLLFAGLLNVRLPQGLIPVPWA